MELQTARLQLRPLAPRDEEWIVRLFGDAEVMRYVGKGVRTPQETATAVAAMHQHWRDHGFGFWILRERVGERFVGRCGLKRLPAVHEVELGYTLFREYWNRGLATEASRAVLQFAFGTLGLPRIVAIAHPDNKASRRVMEKVGLHYERMAPYPGEHEDAAWYAITKDQYASTMTEDRTFLMGKFPALLPAGIRYARNHMWCRAEGERLRFGFTSYAIRLMQDVYFLDWQVSAGDRVENLQEIGHIETSKAESDLFAPLAGVLASFNQELLKDPSGINVDGYGKGWLFEMEQGRDEGLMSVDEYHQFLADNWEKTQRLIKGKINTED